jgi:hypothetical protein
VNIKHTGVKMEDGKYMKRYETLGLKKVTYPRHLLRFPELLSGNGREGRLAPPPD